MKKKGFPMEKISRRDFLKGSGAAAVTLMAGSLVNLKTEAQAETPVQAAAATAEPGKLFTAYVNPQRPESEWRTAEKGLSHVLSPVKIGNIEISNRIVKSAAGSACYLNGLTDELFEYYLNFAKGGVELIYFESVAELEITSYEDGYPAEVVEWCNRLCDECAKYGSTLGYQISGFGSGENAMTTEEIQAARDLWAAKAIGLKQLGFKAVEFNCAGFNMPEHLLSRFHNTRTDEYGTASLENRARFVTEMIEKVKAEVPDMNVQILLDCAEENDNIANNPTIMTLDADVTNPHVFVTTIEEGCEFAKLFEKAGADSLHLRLGPLGHHVAQFGADLYFILNGIEGVTGFGTQYDFDRHWEGKVIGDTQGCGLALDIAAMYKKAVSIPCGLVTYMDPAHAPDLFDDAIAEGKIDFMLMNRPLTVDTEYVNKLKENRLDEIAPCTRCLHCHIGSNQANRVDGYCRVNALTQRVMTENGPATYELPEITTKKKVMVIGGGPAGMEAARIAAKRGHDVTLYEKRASLGFMLDFAAMVKGPHENLADLKKYLERQLEINGVTVKTGVEVTKEMINAEAPDAVILAVGGLRDELNVEGNTPVISMDEFMFTEMGDKVLVYGGNMQAYDAALWLTVQKKKHVTIVTDAPVSDLDKGQSQHAKRMMTTALYSLGTQAYPGATLVSAKDGIATITSDTGVEMQLKCDAIVNGKDMLPNTSLVDGIDCKEVYTIGDCASPYNIALAIRGGNDAGRAV